MKLRLILYVLIFTFSLAAAFVSIQNFLTITRGVSYLAPNTSRTATQFGVNTDLDQYNDADLPRALGIIHEAGFTLVRQHFYWTDIEPGKGEYNWDKWDRIVAGAKQNGLELVAVIDTTPVWARDLGEADLDYASPKNPDDYARFVAAFAKRYDSVRYVQIWDNPNVHPFWGRRVVDPKEYAALLQAAAVAARASNPNVKIISAGLAPNGELIRGHTDYSDLLFLRGMYDAGARDYFAIVGAKPYGMWSGPDDRRADKDVFNFSRAIVLRDEMVAHGDASKPVWAVEFGWNALPKDWRGAPSPWGTDTEDVQGARLFNAVQRAKSEWQWMGALIVQTFQPNAPSDDPIWGLSLVDKYFQPRVSFSALTRAIAAPIQPAPFDFTRSYAALFALAIAAAVSGRRGLMAARQIEWSEYWLAVKTRFAALPEALQFAILVLAVIAFYASRNAILNFALLALIVLLFALRLDLGLAITVFTIPFYLLPKKLIGGLQFSLVELLTIVSVLALVLAKVSGFKLSNLKPGIVKLESADWAVIFFALVGLISVRIAGNFGVANREFRVIVLEPALMYALISATLTHSPSPAQQAARGDNARRIVDALVISALVISLLGLYQFLFTNYVIIGEGVRRTLSVYGSPNNLALYLDRVLPMLVALIVFDESPTLTPRALSPNDSPNTNAFSQSLRHRATLALKGRGRKLFYAFAAIPIALCLYWTYSRAALLFALPAGLVVVALESGRRARIGLGALFIVGIIALIPLTQTERWQSLFQEGTGTGFFRLSVWQSAAEMIRDHPIFGIGLDNFLYDYPKYIKPDAWREPNLSHPHNIILDFWTRMGIAGVIALMWMVIAFFRSGLSTLTLRASSQNEFSTMNVNSQPLRRRATLSRKGEETRSRALVIALMAGMMAAIAHGMIDAAYFFVDLAFMWMVMLGVMAQISE